MFVPVFVWMFAERESSFPLSSNSTNIIQIFGSGGGRGEFCPSFQACFELLGFISAPPRGAGRVLCFNQELILSQYLRAQTGLFETVSFSWGFVSPG